MSLGRGDASGIMERKKKNITSLSIEIFLVFHLTFYVLMLDLDIYWHADGGRIR